MASSLTVFWLPLNDMKRSVEVSGDGSTTLRIHEWDEPYHSRHGAIQESRHVFIEQGLGQCKPNHVKILEMGFGTGLNALLTFLYAQEHDLNISYLGIEAHPLDESEWSQMNYLEQLKAEHLTDIWHSLHRTPRDTWVDLSTNFAFQHAQRDMRDFRSGPNFDLIYFDAFGPRVQPELWSSTIFASMHGALVPDGILVTYCSKGVVRRRMIEAGFKVEKVPGPPGKREMLRAVK